MELIKNKYKMNLDIRGIREKMKILLLLRNKKMEVWKLKLSKEKKKKKEILEGLKEKRDKIWEFKILYCTS